MIRTEKERPDGVMPTSLLTEPTAESLEAFGKIVRKYKIGGDFGQNNLAHNHLNKLIVAYVAKLFPGRMRPPAVWVEQNERPGPEVIVLRHGDAELQRELMVALHKRNQSVAMIGNL